MNRKRSIYALRELALSLLTILKFVGSYLIRHRIGVLISLGSGALLIANHFQTSVFSATELADWFVHLSDSKQEFAISLFLGAIGWLLTYTFAEHLFLTQRLTEIRVSAAIELDSVFVDIQLAILSTLTTCGTLAAALSSRPPAGWEVALKTRAPAHYIGQFRKSYSLVMFEWVPKETSLFSTYLPINSAETKKAWEQFCAQLADLRSVLRRNDKYVDALLNDDWSTLGTNYEEAQKAFLNIETAGKAASKSYSRFVGTFKRSFIVPMASLELDWLRQVLSHRYARWKAVDKKLTQ